MLHIHVLGTPYLLWGERPLTIARRIPRAILYFLAVEGKLVSRSNLQILFWPDEPDTVSRARLRDNLAKLRTALPDPNLIRTIDDAIMLAPDKVQVDLLEFNSLFDETGQLPWQLSPAKPLPAATYKNLTSVAKLWHGPGLLAGLKLPESASLDNWQRAKDTEIQHKLQQVLVRLIDHETAFGNLERVIEWVITALQFDNLDERLHQVLLKTYLNLNRRSEARKHYQEITSLYQIELQSELPEVIRLLRDQIFETQLPTQHMQPLEWSTHANIHTPFVGREDLIEQLNSTCSTGSGVVIFGEAGSGKTRLVQECYKRRETKPRLLMATGHSTESNLPYYSWINLLRRYIRPEEWQQLSPNWVAPLTVILPELKETHRGLQPQDLRNLDHPRTVLLESIHQLLRMLASEYPLILFVDDVHWVDESSLAILSYLVGQSFFDDGCSFLIMAARTEEKNHWLDKFLLNTPSQKLRQIELPNLRPDEVAHLAQYVLENSPSQEFIERLTRDTGGNPLMVLETLQDMLQAGYSRDMEEFLYIPLAPGVHQLIQARMKTLSGLALEILSVGALLGAEFELSLLREIIEEEPVDVLEAFVELEATRFVYSTQQGDQVQYSFVHEKIRESILFDLSHAHKRLLHAKIASALKLYLGEGAYSQAARIAYHHQESGNLLKAYDFWVRAALYAYRLFSVQEATSAFLNAEQFIPHEQGLTEEQLYDLYANWSDMAFENDDPETLFRINETLLSLGQERNSDLLVGTAYDGLSDACFASNQFERGLEFVEKAIPHLQHTENPCAFLTAQMHRGTFIYMLGDFPEARKILYNVLEQMPDKSEPDFKKLNLHLHYQIGILEALMGYPDKALEFLQRAIENKQIVLAPFAAVSIYTAMGLAYYLKGDFKSGYSSSLKAIEMGKRINYQRMLGYAYAYSALSGHNLGLLDEAWEHANHALTIGKEYGHFEISALAYRTFGNTYLRLEDYQPAIEYFQKGIQIAGEHYVALELMALMGYAFAANGQVEDGLEYLTRAYETASQLDLGCISVYARSLLISTQSQPNDGNNNLQEEIEQSLADSKSRSIRKATVLLQAPFVRVSQLPLELIERMNESLQDASQISDLLLEARILRDLIIYKKNRNLSRQSDIDRLNTILEELAPRAVGMPYESAWKKYYTSMMALEAE